MNNVATDLHFNNLVAAHRAARAIRMKMDADNAPDGPEYDAAHDAELEARDALAAARCSRDQFIEKLAYIFACDQHDAGEPPWAGWHYGTLALAVQAFLKRRLP
jgi:hypothetical protein